jgi:heptosyltransferase III
MQSRDPASILPALPHGAHVLVLRLRSLGDTVLMTPALAALHAWRPDLRISVLLEPTFAPILEGNPSIAEVLLLRGSLNAVASMRSRKFHIAYNQHTGPRSAILTAACGAPLRVSWSGRQFSFIYNVEVPPFERFYGRTQGHTAEHQITPFYWTGLPRCPIPPARVYPQPDAIATMKTRLAAHGISAETPYVVLRPGAAAADKRWPVQHFSWLAQWLHDDHGLVPVVNLGPDDHELAATVRNTFPVDTPIFDSLDLRELIALTAGAQLFVGNDSGPTHIAAALERPIVVMFGASDAITWSPWQTPHRLVRHSAESGAGATRSTVSAAWDSDICALTREEVREACQNLLQEIKLLSTRRTT